jgi:hypothetical protein
VEKNPGEAFNKTEGVAGEAMGPMVWSNPNWMLWRPHHLFFMKAPNHPLQPAGFSAGREGWRASKMDKRQTKPVTVAAQPAARTGGVDELANGF